MDIVLSLHRLINIQSRSRLQALYSRNNSPAKNKSFARPLAERRTSRTYVNPVFISCRSTLAKTKTGWGAHCTLKPLILFGKKSIFFCNEYSVPTRTVPLPPTI